MTRNRRISLLILSVLLLATTLATPMAAAGQPRYQHDSARVFLDPGEGATLQAGGMTVVIPEGAFPKGGPIIMHVKWIDGEWFRLDLLPHREFVDAVWINFGEFGDANVYFHGPHGLEPVPSGCAYCWCVTYHFSRYSGWY
jgi:hypothetical protein